VRRLSDRRGRLFVISAPSGSGKTTILHALLERHPKAKRSISMTTRPPRKGERDGRDYRFVTGAQFARYKREGAFLECARVLDHWYGTLAAPIERALRSGRDVLLNLDIQGTRQIRRSGLACTAIFLLPPSLAVLRQRLKTRGTETTAQIQARLELARRELKEVRTYDYAVMNDRLKGAIAAVKTILRAERFRISPSRQTVLSSRSVRGS